MADVHLAVLGDHLGGLAAAVLALRRGRRVLLLETQEGAGSRPLELLNATTAGPEEEPALRRFFHEVGLAPFGPLGDDWIHFRPLDPPLQACSGRHRLTCHVERTARTLELQRELGEEQRHLAGLLRREGELRERIAKAAPAPGEGGSAAARALGAAAGYLRLQSLERERRRTSFDELLRGQGLPDGQRALLGALAQAASRRPAALVPWTDGLRGLRIGFAGFYRNVAGQSGLLTGLRTAFLALGGESRPLVALEAIELPRSGGVSLHLAAAGAVRAERALFDLPLQDACALLPGDTVKTLRRKGLEEGVLSGWGLLELELAPGRRPEVMGDYLALAPSPAEADGPVVLLAADTARGDPATAPCRMEALAFFAPGEEAGGRARISDLVRTVVPFLEESLAVEPRYTHGVETCWSRARIGRGQRAPRLAAGWSPSPFLMGPLAFLRNGDYVGAGLAEALSAALLAAGA